MRFGVVALIVIATATACGGGGGNLPYCPAPLQPVFTMISPAQGATGVADNLSQIVFEGFGPNQVTLAGGTQSQVLTLQPAPTPTPTPQGALPQSTAAISTPLLASTTYTLTYSYTTSGGNCTPQTYTPEVGSFTTK
jgi:hypothetical protein